MADGTTDFQPFATAVGANVLDQADWASLGALEIGFSSGIAISEQFNKAFRQGIFGAATLFNWIVSQIDVNQADDGNLTNAVTNLSNALTAFVVSQQGHFYAYAGNPNGNVAGNAGVAGSSPPDLCEDTTTGHLWVCTTSGVASAAVWSLGAAAGVTQVQLGTGLGTGATSPGGNITSTGEAFLQIATTTALGGIKPDGSTITVNPTTGVASSANAGGTLNPSGSITTGYFGAWASSNTLDAVAPASASQIRTGTDNTCPITSLGEVQAAAFQTLSDAASTNWNMAAGFNARWTLGGNRTLNAPTGAIDGITYSLLVVQPASGGPCSVTWPASFKWGTTGAPTLSTGAGVIDRVYLQYDATSSSFMASFVQGA